MMIEMRTETIPSNHHSSFMNHRWRDFMKRIAVLGGTLIVGALSMTLAAWQQPPARPRAVLPDLQKVKDNFYIIDSSSPVDPTQFTGGNTGVYIADSGVVVVDTKLSGYGADILSKIRAVTSK